MKTVAVAMVALCVVLLGCELVEMPGKDFGNSVPKPEVQATAVDLASAEAAVDCYRVVAYGSERRVYNESFFAGPIELTVNGIATVCGP